MTTETKSTQTDRIRALNDELRKDFNQGHAVMTTGIAALGADLSPRPVQLAAHPYAAADAADHCAQPLPAAPHPATGRQLL